jgi:fluoride exporter
MTRDLLYIFLGGGLGSVVRFATGKWIGTLHGQQFPYGTLAANIAACLILGFTIGLADHKQIISPAARLFWAVGFCGGFSTFSTFSAETISLMQNGVHLSTALYIIGSLVFCISATYVGLYLGEQV